MKKNLKRTLAMIMSLSMLATTTVFTASAEEFETESTVSDSVIGTNNEEESPIIKDKNIKDSGTFDMKYSELVSDKKSFYELQLKSEKWQNTEGTWTFDNGTLTISGQGDMYGLVENTQIDVGDNYDEEKMRYPWSKYYYVTDKIVINGGISSVSFAAFAFFVNLKSVSLPESLKYISDKAFYDYSKYDAEDVSLKEITIPKNTVLDGNGIFTPYGMTIKGYAGSNAEEYAEKHGYDFVVLEDDSEYISEESTLNSTEPTTESTQPSESSGPSSETAEETKAESLKLGDVNLDGDVTIADAVVLNKYLVGSATLSESAQKNADCDKDGNITSSDILTILKYVIGSIDEIK